MAITPTKITSEKRKDFEQVAYNVFDILDSTGKINQYLKDLFSNMSDEEFEQKMLDFIQKNSEQTIKSDS